MLLKMTQFLLKVTFLTLAVSYVCFANELDIDSKTISYSDTGTGKALVLIHAFPTDKRLWHNQVSSLKDHFRVITLDLWGFGQSSPTEGSSITMTEYADQVNSLLTHLEIQHAIIGGESMGGYVTLAYLKQYPEKVSGLILADTQAIADNIETKQKREAAAKDVLKNGTGDLIASFMAKALSPQAPIAAKFFLRNLAARQSPQGVASALRGMALRQDTTDILANTSVPVLIISGDEDMLISPEQSSNMHTLAKNSQLVIIQNAGHLPNLEQSEQWNKAVIEHFGEA